MIFDVLLTEHSSGDGAEQMSGRVPNNPRLRPAAVQRRPQRRHQVAGSRVDLRRQYRLGEEVLQRVEGVDSRQIDRLVTAAAGVRVAAGDGDSAQTPYRGEEEVHRSRFAFHESGQHRAHKQRVSCRSPRQRCAGNERIFAAFFHGR